MKVLFWLRKAKLNKAGTAPLNCRITVEGIRSPDFSTNIRATVEEWNAKTQKFKGISDENVLKNAKLKEIENRLNIIYLDLEKNRKPYTATTIYELYHQKDEVILLKNLFEQYRETQKLKKSSTERKINNLLNNIEEYAEKNFLNRKLLKEIRKSDLERMFLQFKKNNWGNNHIASHLVYLKDMFKLALKLDYLEKSPAEYIDWKKDPDKEIIYLDDEELQRVEEYKTDILRLQKVRDLFVFVCYCGLSFADLEVIAQKDIIIGPDGRDWIDLKRTKTRGATQVPILEKAAEIIKKYGGIEKLPLLTNQKYNGYLKEIQDSCNISKNMTTHVARKTFCVMAVNLWNVPINTVQVMAGHKNEATTRKYYTKVLIKRVANDMKNIK